MKPGRRAWVVAQVVVVCALVAVTYAALLKPQDEGPQLQGITTPNGQHGQRPAGGPQVAAAPHSSRRRGEAGRGHGHHNRGRKLGIRSALRAGASGGATAAAAAGPVAVTAAHSPLTEQYSDAADVLLSRLNPGR